MSYPEPRPLLLRETLYGFGVLIVLFAVMIPILRYQAARTVPKPTFEDGVKYGCIYYELSKGQDSVEQSVIGASNAWWELKVCGGTNINNLAATLKEIN